MNTVANSIRILLLEDSDFDAELVIRELRRGGFSFAWQRVQSREEYRQALEDSPPDLILVDYKLRDFDGEQAVVMAKETCPDVPTIVVTGAVGEDIAVDLCKKGATDFVLKDRMAGRLVGVVERAIAEASNRVARRRAEEQQGQLIVELRRLSTHDPLTGAASRPLLLERLQDAIAGADPENPDAAFFAIELEQFQQLNAIYGSAFVDQLLVETTRRLSELCEEKDTDLVGTFGGDKFFLLLRRDGLERKLPRLLQGIRGCFDRPLHVQNIDIDLKAAIGGVILKISEETTAHVLAQCDEAVRQVKRGKHRGILLADETLIREMNRRSLLDTEIEQAPKTKSLFRLFQPIVDLRTDRIQGAEGLLRFRRRDGSILTAVEIMDALIRTATLSAVDETLITDLLSAGTERVGMLLRREGFRFSFNISAGTLAEVGYADDILGQIERGGATPKSFTLEILEEMLLPTNGTVQENLTSLKQAGVRIAVDDFGIGYSNLLRLSRLPVDELKIPPELTKGIGSGDSRLEAVLAAVIGIAKALGLLIVAEGVEKPSEADYLRELGCDCAQGYLYGKAMSVEELNALVERGGPPGTRPLTEKNGGRHGSWDVGAADAPPVTGRESSHPPTGIDHGGRQDIRDESPRESECGRRRSGS